MARSDFERTAEQVARQLEDIRESMDDLVKNYQGLLDRASDQLMALSQQTRESVKEARSEIEKTGLPAWAPFAAVALIGAFIVYAINRTGMRQSMPARQTMGQPESTGEPTNPSVSTQQWS